MLPDNPSGSMEIFKAAPNAQSHLCLVSSIDFEPSVNYDMGHDL